MAELMDHVEVMADQIGPRPVSTEEEHQASLYLAQELTDDGLEVDVDEFATPTGVRWPYAIAFLLTIAGALFSGVGIFVRSISLTMYVIGIILVAAGIFIYYTETNGRPVLSKMRVGGVSQNVVARYVPAGLRREQRRRKKVIVVAHVDTVRAELEAAPALIRHTKILRRIVYYAMIGVAVLTVVRLLPLPWPRTVDNVLWIISLVGCVYLLAATVCIVARRFTPYVAGGNDNASAAAVLLGVAKRVSDPNERARRSARRRAEAVEEERREEAVPDEAAAAGAPADAPQATGDATQVMSPVASAAPVVHDAQTARAAGVVPDGAEISYAVPSTQGQAAPAADAVEAQATTVIPPVGEAAADGAQGTPAAQPVPAQPVEEVLGEDPNFPEPTYPEIVEDPARDAARQTPQTPAQDQGRPRAGYEPLPDGLFAQTPAESVEGAEEQRAAGSPEPAAQAPVASVPAAESSISAPAPAPEPVAPAPAPEPAAEPAPSAPRQSSRGQGARRSPSGIGRPVPRSARKTAEKSVPSWYIAAKKKAAQDLEARGQEEPGTPEEPTKYRSRYAQIPVNGNMNNVRRAMEPEPEPGPATAPAQAPEQNPAPAAESAVAKSAEAPEAADAPRADAAASAQPPAGQGRANASEVAGQQADVPKKDAADEGAKAPEPQAEAVSAQPQTPAQGSPQQISQEESPQEEAIDFGFLDEEMDDITPDASGVFTAVEAHAVVDAADVPRIAESDDAPGAADADDKNGSGAERGGILKGLTSRIPIIGSSSGSGSAKGTAGAAPRDDQAAKNKIERRKPTARHITQQFQPTKPAGDRDNDALSGLRQEAAVSSTYEGTPQAGPEYDPFVPGDEQQVDAYGNPTGVFPSLSGKEVSSGAPNASDFDANPGNSSSFPSLSGSFPSLSGSFPSLSGQIPSVSTEDFGTPDDADFGYEPTEEDVAESYGNPNLTGEINIPESRFHNAVDKMSGLFSRKERDDGGKKTRRGKKHSRHEARDEELREEIDGGNVDNWDEDDDFGWKGGAYVPDEAELGSEGESDAAGEPSAAHPRFRAGSAFEAARARAAEIRDSVIDMTEDDLLDKEVWFVALGASGAGNQGMKNFLELHGPELRGSLIINLEAVGAGAIHYVDLEGTGKPRRSDRRLQSLVRKASRDLDGTEMRPQKLEWRNTDATPAMEQGLRAMSIMGFDGPAPVAWHWPTDTSAIVDPNNLEYVTELILNMIENS